MKSTCCRVGLALLVVLPSSLPAADVSDRFVPAQFKVWGTVVPSHAGRYRAGRLPGVRSADDGFGTRIQPPGRTTLRWAFVPIGTIVWAPCTRGSDRRRLRWRCPR